MLSVRLSVRIGIGIRVTVTVTVRIRVFDSTPMTFVFRMQS